MTQPYDDRGEWARRLETGWVVRVSRWRAGEPWKLRATHPAGCDLEGEAPGDLPFHLALAAAEQLCRRD